MAMLNLQALGETQAIDEARQQRQFLAQASYSRGAVLLGVAGQDGYRNRELVLEACDLLMDAIQLGRTQVEPYLMLAHVFIVFRDDRQARRYLALAKEIEPGHPDIELYLGFLDAGIADEDDSALAGQSVGQGSSSQNHLAELEGVDPDLLFEQLEKEIHRSLKQAMSSELAVMQPSGETLEVQRAQLEQFSQGLAGMQRQLERLAAEFDVLELSRKLRPLEVLQNRLGRVLEQSERMAGLLHRMAALKQSAEDLLVGVADLSESGLVATAAQFEQLDKLLDDCDAIADGIEELESEKFSVDTLAGPYEVLCEVIATLQDAME